MKEKIAIVLIGVSGSGKSSHVASILNSDLKFEVISKDIIRRRLFEYDHKINFWDQYSFAHETKLSISKVMYEEIDKASSEGSSIIIDNTNLSKSKNNGLQNHLEAKGYRVKFFNLNVSSDINYYLARNANRLDSISSGAVNDQFLTAAASGYIDFNTKAKIAIVDLDGTVALKGDRSAFDYNLSYKDSPNNYVIDTIKSLLNSKLIDYVQFLSGRESFSYDVTRKWLVDQGFSMDDHSLLLRRTKDHRKDVIIKEEIYNNCIKHNDVFAVFDDRPQVVDLWWDLKLPVFHVGDYRNAF